MSYPVPAPEALAGVFATELESRLRLDAQGNPRQFDARSDHSLAGALGKATAMETLSTHLHLRWIADQIMPDTATEYLPRHGANWGVPRRAAIAAVGNVIFTDTPGTVLPAGLLLTLNGVQWQTTLAVTLDAVTGIGTVPVVAVNAGSAGNAPAGSILALAAPLVTLTRQQCVVDASGLNGGSDIESLAAWRGRIIQRIQNPPHGGAYFDYQAWAAQAIGLARVTCIRNWVGAGSVGVAFLMPDPVAGIRVPTAAEIAVVDAYIRALKPVTAELVTMAGTLTPVNLAINVKPNTVGVIAAVTAAVNAYFNRTNPDGSFEFDFGSPLAISRLSEAISAAAGEYLHHVTLPAADVTAGSTVMLRPGTLTITGAP